jgi:hypothetical protein
VPPAFHEQHGRDTERRFFERTPILEGKDHAAPSVFRPPSRVSRSSRGVMSATAAGGVAAGVVLMYATALLVQA